MKNAVHVVEDSRKVRLLNKLNIISSFKSEHIQKLYLQLYYYLLFERTIHYYRYACMYVHLTSILFEYA